MNNKKKQPSTSRSNKRFILITLGILVGIITLLNTISFIKQRSFMSKSHQEKLEIISHSFNDSTLLGSVALVKDGQVIFTKGYGYANQDTQLKNTPDTLYPIASLQKRLTAVIIGQLIREDKLTYDTTIDTFFSDLKYGEQITIRDLLDHTSGYVMPETPSKTVLKTESEQIDNVLKTSEFVEYGSAYYSNGNYSLLANIISQIEKSTYADSVKSRILIPLKMKHTYFWDELPNKNLIPKEYMSVNGQSYRDDSPVYSEELMSTLLGAGNIYSTVNDIVIFFSNLNNGRLLSQSEYEELFGYADPIMMSGNISSDGVMGGYSSYFYGDITNKTFVIFLANQGANIYPDQLLIQVYQQLLLF